MPAEAKPTTPSPASTREPSTSRVAVDDADAGAAEVDLPVAVDARKLRRLAAEDRAARSAAHVGGALDELGHLLRVDRVGGDVVEQEERLGAGGEDVVDAVRGEIRAAPAQLARLVGRARASSRPSRSRRRAAACRRCAKSPAKEPNAPTTPAVAVDATAARSRSTIASAVASETPAAAYVRSSATCTSLRILGLQWPRDRRVAPHLVVGRAGDARRRRRPRIRLPAPRADARRRAARRSRAGASRSSPPGSR